MDALKNYLLELEKPILRFVNGSFFILCAANVFLMFVVSAVAFQRLGSLWVAVVLLFAGFTRLVVHQIKLAAEGKGQPQTVRIFNKKLSNELWDDDIGWGNFFLEDGRPAAQRRITREEAIKHAEELEAKVVPQIVPVEIFALVFATLQWGYGDLLHGLIFGTGV